MTIVNYHFNIRKAEGGGYEILYDRNGKKGQATINYPVEDMTTSQLIDIAKEIGCTMDALAIAVDEYMYPELRRNRSGTTSVNAKPRPCACGCGEIVTSKNLRVQFKQGHDGRLKSRLLKQMRNPDNSAEKRKEAEDALKDWGWL